MTRDRDSARPASVFCIDGSGSRDPRAGDRKRPIYRLDIASGTITRPLLARGESSLDFFARQIADESLARPVLIAADLPIGLPVEPAEVYGAVGASTFLEWLAATAVRVAADRQTWREALIAAGVSERSALRPFVSIRKGDQIGAVRVKRRCDDLAGAESVYCLDHGGKQVGRAALQFWFEVLMPLRERFPARLAVWPFEPPDRAQVVIAECYPAECQRIVFGRTIRKRQPLEVVGALSGLRASEAQSGDIPPDTWLHAASSEDEFDMFTTAFAFRRLLSEGRNIFWHPPDDTACTTTEGWILGLSRARNDVPKRPAARTMAYRGEEQR